MIEIYLKKIRKNFSSFPISYFLFDLIIQWIEEEIKRENNRYINFYSPFSQYFLLSELKNRINKINNESPNQGEANNMTNSE